MALAFAAPRVEVEEAAEPTVITNVAVLDVNGEVGARRDVVLRDGRIASIEPVGGGWNEPGLRVVDGSGRTLLPGLVDVHVHLGSVFTVPGRLRVPNMRRTAEDLLYGGVTTALDLAVARDKIDRFSERMAKGRLAGPTLYRSGKPYTAPGGHPLSSIRASFPGFVVRAATAGMALEVETAADVDDAVLDQGRTGFKKVMLDAIPDGSPRLSDEAVERLALAADALGDRLVAHVGTPDDVDRALALSVDALMHAPSHGSMRRDQAQALARDGIPVTPTLAVWRAAAGSAHGDIPHLAFVDELLGRRELRDLERARAGETTLPESMQHWSAEVGEARDQRGANLRLMRDEHVTLLVGSDSPNIGLPAGSGIHMELAELVDAGLSRSDALRAATWDNSRFLDPDANFGAVRVGWEADLVLVEGDPTTDLRALEQIVGLWTDGRRVTRNAR